MEKDSSVEKDKSTGVTAENPVSVRERGRRIPFAKRISIRLSRWLDADAICVRNTDIMLQAVRILKVGARVLKPEKKVLLGILMTFLFLLWVLPALVL